MLTESEREHIDQHVQQWIRQIAHALPTLMTHMKTETKLNRFDLVTNVDRTVEARFAQFLQMHYPTHQLYGEEAHHETAHLKTGHTWLIDPIDGTANLVKQHDDFCMIIAYFVQGIPQLSYIFDYTRQKLYRAVKGKGAFVNDTMLEPIVRTPLKEKIISFNNRVMNTRTVQDLLDASFAYRLIGACGLDSARVITGQFGAHIHTNAKPWDIAAQFLFAEVLGLKMTDFHQQPIDFTRGGPFIISNPGCYEEILSILLSNGGYQKEC
ncbi:inositol monophosphatase family protein [Staphylococcus lutrae]|uniref:Inositol monophosphatase n=1 Tax=Staphylococcus lutrae TaxID=155085 RepID=A0AAC9RTM7_9STAP|nr:inositol monophosphatase family protein [Staphylococcus lutrae]ARJ50470.1 inositol monophosphatase [Staphylococcus lutrae]PNZ38199.1 inositol monophosphatase family protein [Staphylococcus lutrae]